MLETGSTILTQPSAERPERPWHRKYGRADVRESEYVVQHVFFQYGRRNCSNHVHAKYLNQFRHDAVSNYVEWTGVTGSSVFVGVQERSGGTPWIAGIEIVPTGAAVRHPHIPYSSLGNCH